MINDYEIDRSHFGALGKPIRQTRIHKPKLCKKVPTQRVKYKNAAKLVEECAAHIAAGGRVDAVVSGDFIFGDFLEALFVKQNWLAKRLTISTLSVSKDNVDSLRNLQQGGFVEQLDLLVSDYFFSHNRVNIPYIYEKLDNDHFQLSVASIHTKIILIELDSGAKIVIHGSANFRSSACVEFFTVETSEELYDFHAEWHNLIIDEYKTINKSIRKRDPINCK